MPELTRRERIALIERRQRVQAALAARARTEAQMLALDDFPKFCAEDLGLNVTDTGDGQPYFDFSSEDTPYSRMFNHLTKPNGKFKALFAGRRTGKSYLWMSIADWRLITNRKYRILVGSEKEETAIERCSWMRDRLTALDGKYGKLVSRKWSESKFTVFDPTNPLAGGHPSVYTAGPKKSKTGGHPDLIVLDDLVGEDAYMSASLQELGRRWVTDKLLFQLGRESEIWVIGTMWPGSKHLYQHIFKNIEGSPKLERIAHGVSYYEGKIFDILSFSSGYKERRPVFACLTLEFLDKQFGLNAEMSKCQYDNERLDNLDTDFGGDVIKIHDPPGAWDKGKFVLSEPVTCYAVGDWGTSTKPKAGNSISVWLIFLKTAADDAFIIYGNAGWLQSEVVVETFIDGCLKCQHEYGVPVQKIHVEATGPGAMYGPQIQKAATERGLPLIMLPIPRPSDTHARIAAYLAGPLKAGRLFWSPRILDESPHLLERIKGTDQFMGLAADEITTYSSSETDTKPDILDALSDVWALDKGGNPFCPSPEWEQEREVPEWGTRRWQEWADRKMRWQRQQVVD